MVNVQTGNMLDVVIDGKSIGLKQRDSAHRKYEVIWLPEPENLALVLLAEIKRLNPPPTNQQSVGECIKCGHGGSVNKAGYCEWVPPRKNRLAPFDLPCGCHCAFAAQSAGSDD